MKLVKYIVVKLSFYDPKKGLKKWFEFQPQYDNENIYINMENVNEQNRRNERTH